MPGGVVGYVEESAKGVPGALKGAYEDVNQNMQLPPSVQSGLGHAASDIGNWAGDFAQATRNVMVGTPEPSSKGPDMSGVMRNYDPYVETPAEKKNQQHDVGNSNAAAMNLAQNAISDQMKPIMDQVQGLSSMYEKSMAGFNSQIANEKSTGDPTLDAALKSQSSALQQGEYGMDIAAKGMPAAIAAQEQGLPYADVLATSLNLKKNELQYGTVPSQQINTGGWQAGLQGVYNYIQGVGNTAAPGSAADVMPGALQAAANGAAGASPIPQSGGPAAGQI